MSHKAQAAKLRALGLSQKATARALKVSATPLGNYLTRGKLIPALGGDFSARLDSYIHKQSAKPAGAKIKARPMIGRFLGVGVSLVELAEVLDVDYVVIKNGIYKGIWPDKKTQAVVEGYIDERTAQSQEGEPMINAIAVPQEVIDAFPPLKCNPFGPIKSIDDIHAHKGISHALKLVTNGIEQCDMVAITGPVGSGKTTLLQKLDEWAARRPHMILIRPAVIEKQFLRGSHIIDAILEDLGCALTGRKTLEHRARFVRRALEQAQSDGRRAALVIDEGHLLETSTLLCLKRLYEVEKNCEKLLSIVIVGQTGLARALKTSFQLSELGQRIHLHELGGLNGNVPAYLRHRLDRAGANGRDIFDAAAVKVIAKKCTTPLEVNCLASQALVSAYSTGDKVVSAEDVEAVQGGWRG